MIYIKSVVTHRYTLDDDSEFSMDYELSLSPESVPLLLLILFARLTC